MAVPLLLETGWQDLVERVLVIDCPIEQQIARTMQRDGIDRRQTEAIIATQMERSERLRHADDILSNDDSLASLRNQIITLHQRYLRLAESSRH